MNKISRRDAIKQASLAMGGVLSAPTVFGVLQGCTAKPELTWSPTLFNEDQARLVMEIAEGILPKTDTPGAKELGVPKFIEDIVRLTYKEDFQEAFVSGIDQFEKECKEDAGGSFLDLDAKQRETYLNQKNDEVIKGTWEGPIPPFFRMIKELTIVGYFTTEIGAREVLQYKLIPTRYDGCISLEKAGGKTWAI